MKTEWRLDAKGWHLADVRQKPEEGVLVANKAYTPEAFHSLIQGIRNAERRIFDPSIPFEPAKLPWEPVEGGPCPYCYGQGYDDGGPGSWRCSNCNGVGRLPSEHDAARGRHMNRPRYASLKADHGIEVHNDPLRWGKEYDRTSRIVARDKIGEVTVSTVFLGMNHGYGLRDLWFETMVFDDATRDNSGPGSGLDGECDRYETWDEAVTGHAKMCDMVRSKLNLETA
jgi:hypothetical protein